MVQSDRLSPARVKTLALNSNRDKTGITADSQNVLRSNFRSQKKGLAYAGPFFIFKDQTNHPNGAGRTTLQQYNCYTIFLSRWLAIRSQKTQNFPVNTQASRVNFTRFLGLFSALVPALRHSELCGVGIVAPAAVLRHNAVGPWQAGAADQPGLRVLLVRDGGKYFYPCGAIMQRARQLMALSPCRRNRRRKAQPPHPALC